MVGGLSLSTFRSKSLAGTLATRRAVFCWCGDSTGGASFCELHVVRRIAEAHTIGHRRAHQQAFRGPYRTLEYCPLKPFQILAPVTVPKPPPDDRRGDRGLLYRLAEFGLLVSIGDQRRDGLALDAAPDRRQPIRHFTGLPDRRRSRRDAPVHVSLDESH